MELLEELLLMRRRLPLTLMGLNCGLLFRYSKECLMPLAAYKHLTIFLELAAIKDNSMQNIIKRTIADHYLALYEAVSTKIERITNTHAAAVQRIAPRKWHQMSSMVRSTNRRSKLLVSQE